MKESLEALLDSEKPVLVDYYATWCGPCMAMMPALEALEAELGTDIHFHKIDVDQNIDLAIQQKVMGVPTFVLYLNGKEVWRQAGVLTGNQIRKAIDAHT